MKQNTTPETDCHTAIIALRDTMNVVNGKWKLAIVSSLLIGKKRFGEIKNTITVITSRMLSKELRELEINGVLTRKVIPSNPVIIEYELTQSGMQLAGVIEKMIEWGVQHRKHSVQK